MKSPVAFALTLLLTACLSWAQGGPGLGAASSFSYPPATHCQYGPNLLPATIANPGQYPFQELTGNVVFVNNMTGEVDMTASTPGTWTIKRVSPFDSTFRQLTITARDMAAFAFTPDSICWNTVATATPMITGTNGGTFSSSASQVVLNSSSGEVDCQATPPGSYQITYITPNTCPDTATVSFTLVAAGNPFFSYAMNVFCNVGTATPDTVNTPFGGVFSSSPSGLSLDLQTGAIDLQNSAVGSYAITHTISDLCQEDFTLIVQVQAAFVGDLFEYVDSSFCKTDGAALPAVLGPTGISFSSTPPGLALNSSTGEIDPSASTVGAYLVQATANSVCQETSSQGIIVADSTQLSLQQSGNFLIAPGPGSNFTWYFNGVLVSGATDSMLAIGATGTYAVHYQRVGDDCGTIATGTFAGDAAPGGWMSDAQYYPQPVGSTLHYDLRLARPAGVRWTLCDLMGRVVASGEWAVQQHHVGTLDVSGLGQGQYLLRVEGNGGSSVQPVVIGR